MTIITRQRGSLKLWKLSPYLRRFLEFMSSHMIRQGFLVKVLQLAYWALKVGIVHLAYVLVHVNLEYHVIAMITFDSSIGPLLKFQFPFCFVTKLT